MGACGFDAKESQTAYNSRCKKAKRNSGTKLKKRAHQNRAGLPLKVPGDRLGRLRRIWKVWSTGRERNDRIEAGTEQRSKDYRQDAQMRSSVVSSLYREI